MSTEYLTNSELEDLIAKFDTKDPQDRAVFYALIELRTHRSMRSLENKTPSESVRTRPRGQTKLQLQNNRKRRKRQ